jgi:hypothetical protein
MATKHILIIYLIVAFRLAVCQTISIEFVETPVIYPVGAYGEGKGVFAPCTKNLNRDSIQEIIRNELKKYPKGVLENRARLSQIILSDTMFVSDENGEFTLPALGTYLVPTVEGNIVFLNATDKLLPAILHHEISSVLLCELATTDSLFNERTKKMFKHFALVTPYFYKDISIYNGIEETQNWPENKNNYHVLCNNGYALMDTENDFNEIVKCLFNPKLLKANHALLVDPKLKLWEFLDEAKRDNYEVYKKVMMVIDYYNAIHPNFTEGYFRAFEK